MNDTKEKEIYKLKEKQHKLIHIK